jgi:hypothetical protein
MPVSALALNQNKDAGANRQQRQDDAFAREVQPKGCQAREYEPDGQQQRPDPARNSKSHGTLLREIAVCTIAGQYTSIVATQFSIGHEKIDMTSRQSLLVISIFSKGSAKPISSHHFAMSRRRDVEFLAQTSEPTAAQSEYTCTVTAAT